ncbi:tRNA lysidine(34) synthetase TilS [Alistipes sp. OttesenSCG-928-B03]|nr:tRNA lysidine(34) synthetase TilS [Alistipes sp. OttesenSCG-928-B03]
MENNLYVRFRKYIAEHSLVGEDDRMLLAVSGGVDSMVMMSLFAEGGYDMAVAHCNFQLRGEESYEDEVLVEKEAERYGVPFYNRRFDTAGEMERTGESVQIAARRLRYEWFDELRREHGYTVVAIAHHADDSIETFFINLFRGTGLKGLTGISIVNGRVVRPLLFATRRGILDYAHAHKVPFREDSSNRSTKYLRNKIRLGIVPRLQEINPMFTDVMGRNLQRLTDAQLFINHGIERIRTEVEEHRDGMIYIYPDRIDAGFPVGFVLYELLNAYGFRGDVVDSLCEALRDGVSGKRFYARDMVAYTDRGTVIVAPITEEDTCSVEVAKGQSKMYCGNSVLFFRTLDVDALESLNVPPEMALIDAGLLSYPLEVRRWRDGDSFVPFGMSGHKKVSDYLVDAKVPLVEKQRQFVVVSGGEIVWLVGRRIDDRYKVTSKTENVLKIIKEII